MGHLPRSVTYARAHIDTHQCGLHNGSMWVWILRPRCKHNTERTHEGLIPESMRDDTQPGSLTRSPCESVIYKKTHLHSWFIRHAHHKVVSRGAVTRPKNVLMKSIREMCGNDTALPQPLAAAPLWHICRGVGKNFARWEGGGGVVLNSIFQPTDQILALSYQRYCPTLRPLGDEDMPCAGSGSGHCEGLPPATPVGPGPLSACLTWPSTRWWPLVGPLIIDGGSPMSHVDFKKWQCRLSLLSIVPDVTCQI